ncbi:MAG: cytochrome c [Bacteroidetes bacterium]|nr:cytochrome c [Bacteroidota bacterium]
MKTSGALICFAFLFSCSSGDQDAVNDVAGSDENEKKYAAGEAVYQSTCVACHQAQGEGVKGAFPPLAGSDYLLADKNRAIKQIINGSGGEMIVNGETYNSIMPPQPISDKEIRDVMNYILNSWGNKGGEVTLEEVKAQR